MRLEIPTVQYRSCSSCSNRSSLTFVLPRVHGGGGQDGGSFVAGNRRARASMRYIFHCANVAVLVLFVSGCDPILNIGGTFFPGWMAAILIGSALTVAIRYVFVFT